MTDARFVRRYRIAVLAAGTAWRLFVLWPAGARYALEAVVYGLGLGLLPYAVLAALARFIRARWVLGAVAIAVLGVDVAAFVASGASSSSTAGVSVLLVPLLSLVTVVPAAALLGWLLSGRRRTL